ncbi:hypothetical protein YC2023_124277 [Brassica napus]
MQRLHRFPQLGDRHRETQQPPELDREQFYHHRLHQIGAKPPSSSDSFSPGSIHRTNSRSPPDSSIHLIYVFREHHRPIDISSNDITPPNTHKSIHYPDRKNLSGITRSYSALKYQKPAVQTRRGRHGPEVKSWSSTIEKVRHQNVNRSSRNYPKTRSILRLYTKETTEPTPWLREPTSPARKRAKRL